MKNFNFVKSHKPRFRDKNEERMHHALGMRSNTTTVQLPTFSSKEEEVLHRRMYPSQAREIDTLKKMGFKPGRTVEVDPVKFAGDFDKAATSSTTITVPKSVEINHAVEEGEGDDPYIKTRHTARNFLPGPEVKNWTADTKPNHDTWNHDEGFKKVYAMTKKMEGGYSNRDPESDPGGETNYGITKETYPNLDIKNLDNEQAKQILYEQHYMQTNVDRIADDGVRQVLFDAYVNASSKKISEMVQKTLSEMGKNNPTKVPARKDGDITGTKTYIYDQRFPSLGEGTRGIINGFNADERREFIEKFSERRRNAMQKQPHHKDNPGWEDRVSIIKKQGLDMVEQETKPLFEDKRHPHHPQMKEWQKQQKQRDQDEGQNKEEERQEDSSEQEAHMSQSQNMSSDAPKIQNLPATDRHKVRMRPLGPQPSTAGNVKVKIMDHQPQNKDVKTLKLSSLMKSPHHAGSPLRALMQKAPRQSLQGGLLAKSPTKAGSSSSKETLVRRGDQVYRVGGKRGSRGSFYSD